MPDFSCYGEISEGIRYLSVLDIRTINRFLIQIQTPSETIAVLKENELASSQARPNIYRYYNHTEDMFKLAASLIESLILNHPFANANKRTAAFSGYMFLLINGYELTAPENDVVEMMLGIANKKYLFEDIENWLCYWSRDFDTKLLSIPPEKADLFAELAQKHYINSTD